VVLPGLASGPPIYASGRAGRQAQAILLNLFMFHYFFPQAGPLELYFS
jgi:hypothetical protein